jgi:hypothetical protein
VAAALREQSDVTWRGLRKTISLEIIDEESYEKSMIMYVNIGDPRQIAGRLLVPHVK